MSKKYRGMVLIFLYYRKSKKPIPKVCRGFWEDHRHLQNQFKYLTKTSGLLSQVEMNFKKQMGMFILQIS